MNFALLPKYPATKERRSAAFQEKTGQGLFPRVSLMLLNLTVLVVIAAMLYSLRRTATAVDNAVPPPPRPPLDFKFIQERFGKVPLFASREEAEEMLGPPSPVNDAWEPDFREWMATAEHSHRHTGMPSNRTWDVWSDPKDDDKGVAILFAGGKVYYKAKKGF